MKFLLRAILVVATALAVLGGPGASSWKVASETELRALIPARAPVESERIETEFRTASGIVNPLGKYIAGVVLITAGYAAEGKYSNFFMVQAPLKIESLYLREGTYVFGWKRKGEDALAVNFYEARSGHPLGTVQAERTSRVGRIDSFRISPPAEKPQIHIGRFAMKYQIVD